MKKIILRAHIQYKYTYMKVELPLVNICIINPRDERKDIL